MQSTPPPLLAHANVTSCTVVPLRAQLAHLNRQLKARAEEARLSRQNAERLYTKVARFAEQKAKLEAAHAAEIERAAERERGLQARLARARARREAPRAEPQAYDPAPEVRAHTPVLSHHASPRVRGAPAESYDGEVAAFGHLTTVPSLGADSTSVLVRPLRRRHDTRPAMHA